MSAFTETQFDPNALISELIEAMGMADEPSEKLVVLRENMEIALTSAIFDAAAENLEVNVVEAVMEELKDEEDATYILKTIIKNSPGAQIGMIQAIEEFKQDTLDAFKQLS